LLTFQTIIDRLEEHPIIHRLVSGAFWLIAASGISRLFSLVASVVIARILGRVDFGAYGMVQNSIETFAFFAGFGLRSTGTIRVAHMRSQDPDQAGAAMSFSTVASIITATIAFLSLLYLAPWLAQSSLKRSDLSIALSIGALLLFFLTLSNASSGCLSGLEAFDTIARITFWRGLVGVSLCVPLAWAYGINGAMAGLSATALLELSLLRLTLRQQCKIYRIPLRWSFNLLRKELPVIWNLALPSFFHGLVVVLAVWLCNVILVRQRNGYAEMGIFNAANQWSSFVTFIPQVLPSVMLPIFSEMFHRKLSGEFDSTLALNVTMTWIISLPMAILVIAVREPLANLFGKQFSQMSLLMPLLMVSAFLSILNAVLAAALSSTNRAWIGMWFNTGWAIILVGLTLFLTPHYGGLGLVLAYSIAYFVHTTVQLTYVQLKLAPSAKFAKAGLIILTAAIISLVAVPGFAGIRSKLFDLIALILAFLPISQWVRRVVSQNTA
jgi:O-antigen/teichoic acid export membrane protein